MNDHITINLSSNERERKREREREREFLFTYNEPFINNIYIYRYICMHHKATVYLRIH